MASLGERLRRTRLAKGIDLTAVASETKISTRYLEALEQDDWTTLPGKVFARNFARQYARVVGMEEGEIEADLKALAEAEQDDASGSLQPTRSGSDLPPIPSAVGLSFPEPRRWHVAALWLLGTLVACTTVYVVWTRYLSKEIASLSVTKPSEAPPVAAPKPKAEEPPAAAPIAPAVEGKFRVDLLAKERVWIQIRADGRFVFAGEIEQGTTRAVEASREVRLRLGNAAAVDVSWNGKLLEPAGPRGQVRNLVLGPEGVAEPPREQY